MTKKAQNIVEKMNKQFEIQYLVYKDSEFVKFQKEICKLERTLDAMITGMFFCELISESDYSELQSLPFKMRMETIDRY